MQGIYIKFTSLLIDRKEGIKVCTDEQLVREFIDGNDNAFAQIVDKYKSYVFAIILRFTNQSSDTQDIAQEVFLQIYKSLPEQKSQNLKGWIGKITTSKAIDWKRSNVKRNLVENIDQLVIVDSREFANPDEAFINKENSLQVRQACLKLPDHYSQVMIKYYFEGKSYQDIAKEEGISVKTVESRLYRARSLFRQRWEVME